jgi:hypothetical protein
MVGRTAVFLVGLAVILALVFGIVIMLLGTNDGQTTGISRLVGSDAGADQALNVDPLAMLRTPTQGYALVIPTCASAATPVCQFEDSKAV